MSGKQEEIRRGVFEIVKEEGNYETYDETVNQLLTYLHSQGVMIRVDGELPNITCINTEDYVKGFMSGIKMLEVEVVKAGCGFFEPLIKGE